MVFFDSSFIVRICRVKTVNQSNFMRHRNCPSSGDQQANSAVLHNTQLQDEKGAL